MYENDQVWTSEAWPFQPHEIQSEHIYFYEVPPPHGSKLTVLLILSALHLQKIMYLLFAEYIKYSSNTPKPNVSYFSEFFE